MATKGRGDPRTRGRLVCVDRRRSGSPDTQGDIRPAGACWALSVVLPVPQGARRGNGTDELGRQILQSPDRHEGWPGKGPKRRHGARADDGCEPQSRMVQYRGRSPVRWWRRDLQTGIDGEGSAKVPRARAPGRRPATISQRPRGRWRAQAPRPARGWGYWAILFFYLEGGEHARTE